MCDAVHTTFSHTYFFMRLKENNYFLLNFSSLCSTYAIKLKHTISENKNKKKEEELINVFWFEVHLRFDRAICTLFRFHTCCQNDRVKNKQIQRSFKLGQMRWLRFPKPDYFNASLERWYFVITNFVVYEIFLIIFFFSQYSCCCYNFYPRF